MLNKPLLKWAGGKRWLIPHVQPLLNGNYSRLVEPFAGGLAVTIGLDPQRALVNDLNCHLINFYQWVKRGLVVEIDMRNDSKHYYQHRDRFNSLVKGEKANTREAASLFYYLNRTGFNGLCRFNQKGLFNVPMGRYKKINYTRDFTPYQEMFKKWEFVSGDFSQIGIQPNDTIYADPPYDGGFVNYNGTGFSWDDQVRLAHWLGSQEGLVITSNKATDRIVKLYKDNGFELSFLDAPRRISANGNRNAEQEVLAIKNQTKLC